MKLDLDFVRDQFPAFRVPALKGQAFFENAGGSFACIDTIDSLNRYYRENKVQPYSPFPASTHAGAEMDRAHLRWGEALGVNPDEVVFGPSTSANTYVLAHALGQGLEPGDEVVVTNQDHEANTGALRRATERAGASVREWTIDPDTGLLDIEQLADLLGPRTKVVAFPHCSNIIGQENDVETICKLAHTVGALTVVDGVSFVPHTIPNVASLGADIYLFSLYKVYSVHQGLMVIREDAMSKLSNQGHYFNNESPWYRMSPAGPDHAQVAAANGVLDYVERLDAHHHPSIDSSDRSLEAACRRVSKLWRTHESTLLPPVLGLLGSRSSVRLLGPASLEEGHDGAHRCPTVAFQVLEQDPGQVATDLVAQGILTSSGNYYAVRVLEGLQVSPDPGVVRVSWVHYTSTEDVQSLLAALDSVLA